jgi:hypothetical protein
MTYWLYQLPTWQLATVILGSLVMLSILLTMITHRYFTLALQEKYELISLFSSSFNPSHRRNWQKRLIESEQALAQITN